MLHEGKCMNISTTDPSNLRLKQVWGVWILIWCHVFRVSCCYSFHCYWFVCTDLITPYATHHQKHLIICLAKIGAWEFCFCLLGECRNKPQVKGVHLRDPQGSCCSWCRETKLNPNGSGSGQQFRCLLIKCQLPRWMWLTTQRAQIQHSISKRGTLKATEHHHIWISCIA